MLRTATLLLLLSCCCLSASAQGENNIWCFGHRTGLDFTCGKNEIVKATLLCPGMTTYSFVLYNRYGQRVFETNDPDTGRRGCTSEKKLISVFIFTT